MNAKFNISLFSLGLFLAGGGTAVASSQQPQTWLPGECIPQFVAPLPVFGPAGPIPRVDALKHPALTVKMKETPQQVLPNGAYTNYFGTANVCPTVNLQPTKVWGYETSDALTGKLLGPAHWPAVTLETRRYVPTLVKYVNELPNGPGSLQELVTVDKTLHWADPLHSPMMNPCMDNPEGTDSTGGSCAAPYGGPVPAVPHLHGGEVPSQFDGGPDAWFTPAGSSPGNNKFGPAYSTIDNPGPGKAIYLYNNFQEPGTPWFHDHALGVTRTNVYSGLAGFYFIRDPKAEPNKLPDGPYEIEMAIQDRQFDANSQLFFPDGSGDSASNLNGTPPNPNIHPFWIPEFAGDVVVVNATPWPSLKVEPRRYRFRVVNGSNARFYNLSFGSAPVYAIGADDSYLDKPVKVGELLIAPGERSDLIVDFTALKGATVTVTNDAPVPFPSGLSPVPFFDPDLCPEGGTPCPADQPQMASIMQFQVTEPLKGKDKSCNPSVPGQCKRPQAMVKLSDGKGNIVKKLKIAKVRQFVLKEHMGFDTTTVPPTETGPLEVLVNNTKWDGLRSPNIAIDFPTDGISELPQVGTVELWEIINLTMDAHPMHTHLTQFQVLDRQQITDAYSVAWAEAFKDADGNLPAVCDGIDPLNPCPGYGPPLRYNTGFTKNLSNGQTGVPVLGGNPLLVPSFLVGAPLLPAPEESGWKDTTRALPGQVTRILVRWTPTSASTTVTKPGLNLYPFDPTKGPGYVWHCHIIDHEDNEMMRPYKVTK